MQMGAIAQYSGYEQVVLLTFRRAWMCSQLRINYSTILTSRRKRLRLSRNSCMRANSRRRALTNPTRTSLNSKSDWAKFRRGDCARMRAQSPLREINLKDEEWTPLSLLRRDTEFLRTNATKMIGARSRAAWMVKTSRAQLRARA